MDWELRRRTFGLFFTLASFAFAGLANLAGHARFSCARNHVILLSGQLLLKMNRENSSDPAAKSIDKNG